MLSHWMKQDYTQEQMRDLLHQETGCDLSRSQIRYDMKVIRKRWLKEQQFNYHSMVNEELARLDSLEHELWKNWRESKEGKVQKKRIEKVLDETAASADADLVIARVVEEVQDMGGDTTFLRLIIQTQQERRKLLGLYAPSRIGVDIRKEERKISVKGYVGISPADWPGEAAERKQIEEAIEGEFEAAD